MLLCPKCGKSENEKDFIESFCSDCYTFNIKVPMHEEIKQCKKCDRIFVHGEWQKEKSAIINRFISKRCKGEFKEVTYDGIRKCAVFLIEKEDRQFFVEILIDIKFVKTMCSDCSRISGGYYEAIVQLRGDGKRIERYKKMIERLLKRTTFISKIENAKGGIDIYSGNTKKTLIVLGQLGQRYIMTKKLIGTREGKRIYRTTFSIRF